MSLADRFQHSLNQTAQTNIALAGTPLIRVIITSLTAGNSKAFVRRLDAEDPDGIAYPILAGASTLTAGDMVYAISTSGGLVIVDKLRDPA